MSRWRPFWRQLRADPWGSMALGLLVLLVSVVGTVLPRAVEDMAARQLVTDVSDLSAAQRDVTARVGATMITPPEGSDPWAPVLDGLRRIQDEQPRPLRDLLQPAQVVTELTSKPVLVPAAETTYYEATVTLRVDPHLADKVTVVEGEMPSATYRASELRTSEGTAGRTQQTLLPVLVLDETATKMHWSVGEQVPDAGLVVAGLYRPKDPQDRYWQHVPNGIGTGVLVDPARGQSATLTAFLAPQNPGTTGAPSAVVHQLWFPVDPARVPGDEVRELRRQLTGMTSRTWPVTEADADLAGQSPVSAAFRSELASTLDRVLSRQSATSAVLAVLVSGPVGVALAVLALGARLVVRRRTAALGLALARGASLTQLRMVTAGEGLLLGVPAALLGHLVGLHLTRSSSGAVGVTPIVLTALLAATPAVALALTVDRASLLPRRRDLGSATSRARRVAEVAVLALAAIATWRLVARGPADAAAGGVDLLAAATPVLLALAACVLALRLYPVPLALLTRVLHRRRRLTPFVGAARSLRDPVGGLVPVLAVVLGTGIALTSAVVHSTVTRGGEVATWTANGADLRISGPRITPDVLEQIRGVDGVAAAGTVAEVAHTSELVSGTSRTPVQLLVVDPALQQVWRDAPLADAPPEAMFQGGVVTTETLPGSGTVELTGVGQLPIVGQRPAIPGMVTRSAAVAVSADTYRRMVGDPPTGTLALVAVREGDEPRTVAADLQQVLGAARVDLASERLADQRSAPVAAGMTRLVTGAVLASTLLTAVALVLVQLVGAESRARLLAVLRTLGASAGQTRALTAWELGPLVAVAMLVGGALGLVLPALLVRTVDLTALTGGEVQPTLHLDAWVVGGVLAGVLLVVLIAITLSAWSTGRTTLAQQLRVGEEA